MRTVVFLCGAVGMCALTASCSKKSGGTSSAGAPSVKGAAAVKARSGRPGRVAYMLPDKRAYTVEARAGATPVAISAALDKISKGEDETVHLARDGTWIALTTTRFGCDGWACLAVALADLSGASKVEPSGKEVHPEGPIAVAPSGVAIVWGEKGPHERDLFLTRRNGDSWSAPILLTGASKSPYNAQPAFSYDGNKVLFDCGTEPYGQEGTGICEVNADGSGFRQVLTPGTGWAGSAKALHHADYAPDGSIVFEADRKGDRERIWRLAPGQAVPKQLGNFGNDNSPCVLPNGTVVSLWMTRPGGDSKHEIKAMGPDGSSDFMILTGTDVLDSQISCGW